MTRLRAGIIQNGKAPAQSDLQASPSHRQPPDYHKMATAPDFTIESSRVIKGTSLKCAVATIPVSKRSVLGLISSAVVMISKFQWRKGEAGLRGQRIDPFGKRWPELNSADLLEQPGLPHDHRGNPDQRFAATCLLKDPEGFG